jgi:hypothetical protein
MSREVLIHYLLFYDYAVDYMERRPQFRGEHLKLAWAAVERGELVLAGALDQPPDGAVFVFRADSLEVVERFVAADPYVQNGLVTGWRARPWNTVVGELATSPVRPPK